MAQTEGALLPLIGDLIMDSEHYIENLFADRWKKPEVFARIKGVGFPRPGGIDIMKAVFLLLLWKWLNVYTIAMSSRNQS